MDNIIRVLRRTIQILELIISFLRGKSIIANCTIIGARIEARDAAITILGNGVDTAPIHVHNTRVEGSHITDIDENEDEPPSMGTSFQYRA